MRRSWQSSLSARTNVLSLAKNTMLHRLMQDAIRLPFTLMSDRTSQSESDLRVERGVWRLGMRFTKRRHWWALLAGTLLAALLALCAWGSWVAAQPDLGTFLLPGARDIRYAPVGPGMQS